VCISFDAWLDQVILIGLFGCGVYWVAQAAEGWAGLKRDAAKIASWKRGVRDWTTPPASSLSAGV
jgi:hypothetical protein